MMMMITKIRYDTLRMPFCLFSNLKLSFCLYHTFIHSFFKVVLLLADKNDKKEGKKGDQNERKGK